MKLFIINCLNYLIPDHFFKLFQEFNSELLVIKEMGPHKFIIYIFFLFLFFLFLIFFFKRFKLQNIYLIIKEHILIISCILLFSLGVNYKVYNLFIENPNIFYNTTVDQVIYDPLIYFSLFAVTNIIFYFFTFYIFKNKKISFLICTFWIFSAQHISNLYPSLLRDYIKVLFFFVNFLFIVYFLKNKITNQKIYLIYYWLFFICVSLLFKADLKLIFPIFLYIIFVNEGLKIEKKKIIYFTVLFIVFISTYLVNSVYDSRDLQRLGGSLGVDLYNINTKYILGPFEDSLFFYKACAHYQCNEIKYFLLTSFYQFNIELLKFFKMFTDILLLPFKNNLLSDSSNIINNLLFYKSILFKPILALKYVYFLIFIFFIFFYARKNRFELIHFLVIYSYFAYIYSLQKLLRHYFYLEGVSLIIFFLISKELIKFLNITKKK